MYDQDKLIDLLNQAGTQSGTALGAALGISRAAVQKRIQALLDNGLPITAVPSKGYTLEDGVSLLSAQTIAEHIIERKPLAQGQFQSLDVLQSVPSTNSFLLERSIEQAKMRVCVAEAQPAGRGRRGNDWQSAPYRNIMLSVSWGFASWPETITGLGLAVAQTVVELLNKDYGVKVSIKWPNDLMVDNAKLGGILIDVAGEASGVCNVVIGLGLNIHQPIWQNTVTDYPWLDLYSLGVRVDRNCLTGQIVVAWLTMLIEFEKTGFAPLAERWNALSSYAEKRIRVGAHDNYIQGKMLGVDSVGALLVAGDDGQTHRFSESNVSVRLID